MITLNSTDMQTKADTSSLVTLFKRHTVDHDQPARVFFEERSLSYPELDIASDSISDFLRAHKLPAEALVAVLLPRSIEAISSQLIGGRTHQNFSGLSRIFDTRRYIGL